MKVTVKIAKNKVPDFMRQYPQAVDDAILETCIGIEQLISALVRVDTGALRHSWYHITPTEDTYLDKVAAARELKPDVEIVEPPFMSADEHNAVVGSAVAHALPNEYGTVHMSARPALHPTAERYRRLFPKYVAEHARRLADRLSD